MAPKRPGSPIDPSSSLNPTESNRTRRHHDDPKQQRRRAYALAALNTDNAPRANDNNQYEVSGTPSFRSMPTTPLSPDIQSLRSFDSPMQYRSPGSEIMSPRHGWSPSIQAGTSSLWEQSTNEWENSQPTEPPLTTLNSPLQSPFASYHSLSPLETQHTPASSTQESPISSRTSRATRFESILKILREGRMSPIDLMLEILDPSNVKYDWYRTGLFHTSPEKVQNMLDLMMQHDQGSMVVMDWLRPQVAEWACQEVYREMDAAKDSLLLSGGVGDLTPEYLETWSQSNILGTASAEAPILLSILHAGAQTQKAREKNTKKTSHLACQILVTQLAYQRSNRSSKFHGVFGLFLWTTGCQRQTIDALFRCGLSVSYDSVLSAVQRVGELCVQRAISTGRGPHLCAYDNINISTSIHVEQRGESGPSKVQSGTFAVIYELRNANREDMLLAPIMQRFRNATPLDFATDLRETMEQTISFHKQLTIVIVRVLTTYCAGFESYKSSPMLQHTPRRPMPPAFRTKQYPLRTSTIEEASVDGNIAVHEDIYITQLGRTEEDLCELAIPSINDQSTNARIRGAKILRARDANPWTRREVFQLGFGLFHLCLNLVWSLLHTHRGSLAQIGSLTYFFALIEKARLGSEHPDYYTLLASLEQIVHGLLLNAWRTKCGFSSLADYAKSKPTTEDLLDRASEILRDYASPAADSESGSAPPSNPPPKVDSTYNNVRLLTRDLVYVLELISAISDGDFGRVEDFLPQLAMMFRGAGANNYCTEILHFLFNLKKVWTKEFADIMRDNMLVNISGLPGHAMPVDLNIEHLIGYLKALFVAKGLYSTWDRLGDISAGIAVLQHVKKEVNLALSTAYRGTTHCTPDTSHLVWRIANKARELELQKFVPARASLEGRKRCIPDILALGQQRLESSSLATFNKKVMAMVQGLQTDDSEEDELPAPALSLDPGNS